MHLVTVRDIVTAEKFVGLASLFSVISGLKDPMLVVSGANTTSFCLFTFIIELNDFCTETEYEPQAYFCKL